MNSIDYIARKFFSKSDFDSDFIEPAKLRKDLEEATRDRYEEFDNSGRKSWAYSRYYVFD